MAFFLLNQSTFSFSRFTDINPMTTGGFVKMTPKQLSNKCGKNDQRKEY